MVEFYPDDKYTNCAVCGIASFAHRHRPNTLPKDFERINVPQNLCAECKDLPEGHVVKGHDHRVNVPSDHPPKKQMSMSQTLRAVLFLRWEREVGKMRMTSEDFYQREMTKIINNEKAKL